MKIRQNENGEWRVESPLFVDEEELKKRCAPIKIDSYIMEGVLKLIRIGATQFQFYHNTDSLILDFSSFQELFGDDNNSRLISYHAIYGNNMLIGEVKCEFILPFFTSKSGMKRSYPLRLEYLNSLEFNIEESKTKFTFSVNDIKNILKKELEDENRDVKNCIKMEIHFYKSLDGQHPSNLNISHSETIEAINYKDPIINTTAITALDFDLLKKGYRIFLHENDKVGELTLGENVFTDKFLRDGHNVAKLWIGGAFSSYFDEKN